MRLEELLELYCSLLEAMDSLHGRYWGKSDYLGCLERERKHVLRLLLRAKGLARYSRTKQ